MNILLERWGKWSSFAANTIDQYLLEDSNTWFSYLWNGFKARFVYTAFFVPLLVIDFVISSLTTMALAMLAAFSSDAIQASFLESFKTYSTLVGKSFYALMASIIGFFEPEMALFFTEYSTVNTALKPQNADELKSILQRANNEGLKVCVRGAGFSQGKQSAPGFAERALVIDMSAFNYIRVHDDDSATVGAGAIWQDVQLEANKHKKALSVMQASNVFSVGGSIGSNIHGWDHHTGVLANTIKSLEVMKADGEVVTTYPGEDLFNHVVGGYGLYGIVLSAKMKLVDNELLKRTSKKVEPKDYVNHFIKHVRDDDSKRMHLYRLSLKPGKLLQEGFTDTYEVEDATPRVTKNLEFEGERGTRAERILVRFAKRFDFARDIYWRGEQASCDIDHEPMTTNDIMQPPINALLSHAESEKEWLQEYFIPGDELAGFIESLGHLLDEHDVKMLNASVRFVKQYDASPLSYAHSGDKFAVVLCFNQSMQPSKIIEARKWLREAQNLAVQSGGTYYLPYQHVSSPETFKKSYPHAEKAKAYKEQVDPQGIFNTGMYDKYLQHDYEADGAKHVKSIMKSPEHREAFKGFISHVLMRGDIDALYKVLDDVLEYCDTHEEIYAELCQRRDEFMPNTLTDIQDQLGSLDAIKKALGQQAKLSLPLNTTKIDGIVEVGSPGRYVQGFKAKYDVSGKVYSVNATEPSWADCIDAGALHPYDTWVKLDYDTPDLSQIPSKSVDVVTCYIGLHHFPNEAALSKFLQDVRRVLRDDGHFLLVDHDAPENTIQSSMAHMAHFIFNAVNGVSVEGELAEVRNFKSIADWRAILEKHDLFDATEGPDVPMIREGDPSCNRMVSFSPTSRLGMFSRSEHVAKPNQDKVDNNRHRSKL